MSAAEFRQALKGGHYAAILEVAARRVLHAADEARTNPDDPELQHNLGEALVLLADCCPEADEQFDPVPYIESQTWTFARTVPQRPHEYVHVSKTSDWRMHLKFVRWLRTWGEMERYGNALWPYRTVGEWRYWAGSDPNWTIINRRRAAE